MPNQNNQNLQETLKYLKEFPELTTITELRKNGKETLKKAEKKPVLFQKVDNGSVVIISSKIWSTVVNYILSNEVL